MHLRPWSLILHWWMLILSDSLLWSLAIFGLMIGTMDRIIVLWWRSLIAHLMIHSFWSSDYSLVSSAPGQIFSLAIFYQKFLYVSNLILWLRWRLIGVDLMCRLFSSMFYRILCIYLPILLLRIMIFLLLFKAHSSCSPWIIKYIDITIIRYEYVFKSFCSCSLHKF